MSTGLLPQEQAEACFISHLLHRGSEGIPMLPPAAFTVEAHFILYSAWREADRRGRTPVLANINDYVAENDRWLRRMMEIAKESGMQPDAWTNLVYQLAELPGSRGAMQDIASDLAEAHSKRQQAEIGKLMLAGDIDPQKAVEMLGRLNSSAPIPPKFADVAKLIEGGLRREVPSVAEVAPGAFLFYRSRLNEIHAEPSVGKTNVILAASGKVLAAGGRVLFVDPEDSASAIIQRLLAYGADTAAAIERFHYIELPKPDGFAALHAWAVENKPDLAILDGLASGMAAEGHDENEPRDVLQFFRERLRPLCRAGAAVVVTDHVVKSAEGRGRWSRGSGAKIGDYDGVSYEARLVEAYTPTKDGKVSLVVSKDRNGGVGPTHRVVYDIGIAPSEAGTNFAFTIADQEGKWRPTHLMEKVCEELEKNPLASQKELRKLGKAERIDQAMDALEEDGFIRVERPGRPHPNRYHLVKRFKCGEA